MLRRPTISREKQNAKQERNIYTISKRIKTTETVTQLESLCTLLTECIFRQRRITENVHAIIKSHTARAIHNITTAKQNEYTHTHTNNTIRLHAMFKWRLQVWDWAGRIKATEEDREIHTHSERERGRKEKSKNKTVRIGSNRGRHNNIQYYSHILHSWSCQC